MTTELVRQQQQAEAIEAVLIEGDLSKLTPEQRVIYYKKTCDKLKLNHLTKPFAYIRLNGKLTLYALKDCTEQLRKRDGVSICEIKTQMLDGVFVVTAYAKAADGKEDVATGAVNIQGLKGEALANALMKAECVPLDYEILTDEGFKSYLDVAIGQNVAAYNCKTDAIEWVPLKEVNVYPNQAVKTYENAYASFDFTKGHKWVWEQMDGNKNILKPFEDVYDNSRLKLCAKEKNGHPYYYDVTPDEAAILGWLITDGTIKKYKGKFYRAAICQSKPEYIEALNALLPRTKHSVTCNRERGWKDQNWWYFSVEETRKLCDQFDFNSYEDLPRIAAHLDFECRQAMLDAMMMADGDKRGTFGKGKREVIECFQILCTLNGIALSRMKTRWFKNSTQPFYLVRQFNHTGIVKKNLTETDEYIADVWCPTTKHGTWIMRSPDGQIAITGNTKAKRRVTLSICGLGMTDEGEVETIPDAKKVDVDFETGEIISDKKSFPKSNEPKTLSHKSIDDILADIKKAQTEESLRKHFNYGYLLYQHDSEKLEQLVQTKDDVKDRLIHKDRYATL